MNLGKRIEGSDRSGFETFDASAKYRERSRGGEGGGFLGGGAHQVTRRRTSTTPLTASLYVSRDTISHVLKQFGKGPVRRRIRLVVTTSHADHFCETAIMVRFLAFFGVDRFWPEGAGVLPEAKASQTARATLLLGRPRLLSRLS